MSNTPRASSSPNSPKQSEDGAAKDPLSPMEVLQRFAEACNRLEGQGQMKITKWVRFDTPSEGQDSGSGSLSVQR
jgi:hypothetical protein